MRIFQCPVCDEALFFENSACACGAQVAYDPERRAFVAAFTPCANRAEHRLQLDRRGRGRALPCLRDDRGHP